MKKALTLEEKEQIIRLRKIREDLGYSQEQFAASLELSISAYKKMEAFENRISLESLHRIYDTFHVSIDYILFGVQRNAEEVWKGILNCCERDKVKLFLRLHEYLSHEKKGIYPKVEDQLLVMEQIVNYAEDILHMENTYEP